MSAPITHDEALLWIGATDAGWAPWLAEGGRVDGGAVPAEDAPIGPSLDPDVTTGTTITRALTEKPASAVLHFYPSARLTIGDETIAICDVTMHERGSR